MIYEWYAGSDESNEVARVFSVVLDKWEKMSPTERTDAMEPLLDIEKDRNFRAAIISRIAYDWLEEGNNDKSVAMFLEACELFDPFAANFQNVVGEFGLTMQRLVFDHACERDEPELAIRYCSGYFAFVERMGFEDREVSLMAAMFAQSLNKLGDRDGSRVYYQMALPWALKSHHLIPDDLDHLLTLANCYHRLNDLHSCQDVLSIFERYAPKSEYVLYAKKLISELGDEGQK